MIVPFWSWNLSDTTHVRPHTKFQLVWAINTVFTRGSLKCVAGTPSLLGLRSVKFSARLASTLFRGFIMAKGSRSFRKKCISDEKSPQPVEPPFRTLRVWCFWKCDFSIRCVPLYIPCLYIEEENHTEIHWQYALYQSQSVVPNQK